MSRLAPKGYMDGLFLLWANKLDHRHMGNAYREMFDAEVEANGFRPGEKSFIVTGQFANNDAQATYACLMRGGYPVAYLDALTLIKRLDNKWVPGWTDADDAQLSNAEVIILTGVFVPDFIERMSDAQKLDLMWFILRCIEQEQVMVLPMPKEADLNFLGEDFGEFIERNFEVFHDGATTSKSKATKKGINRSRGNGGDAATRKRAGK